MHLIAYFDTPYVGQQPRYLKSNKPPCPLCRLFAWNHGKYQLSEGDRVDFTHLWQIPGSMTNVRVLEGFAGLLHKVALPILLYGTGYGAPRSHFTANLRVPSSVTSSSAPPASGAPSGDHQLRAAAATMTNVLKDNKSAHSVADVGPSTTGQQSPKGVVAPNDGANAGPAGAPGSSASGAVGSVAQGKDKPETLAKGTAISGILSPSTLSITYDLADVRLTVDYVGGKGAGPSTQQQGAPVRLKVELLEDKEDTVSGDGGQEAGGKKELSMPVKTRVLRIVTEPVSTKK